jgi:uncharacterized membrane protein (DUF373 family)
MIQVTYISSETKPMEQSDLEDILSKSRKNNIELGITGMLLYGNKTFIQILEGDEKSVDNLLLKIRKDPRHTDFRMVAKKEIKHRQYSEWSMGFKNITKDNFELIEGIHNLDHKDFNTSFLANHASIVDALMEHYRKERSKRIKNEELSLHEEDKLIVALHHTIRAVVKILAVFMVFVIILGIVDVIYNIYENLISPGLTNYKINSIVSTFGGFLAVLIAIEIFINITLYIRKDVIHIKLVIATALMAIARKVIIFDFKQITPIYIFGTASVILALGITYWLIEKNSKLNESNEL